jgi:hypothetical protein
MTILSPSRIKTFESCSYLYYCKYLLKLPDPGNAGAAIGSAVHELSEILFGNKPKYKKVVDSIIENGVLPRRMKRYLARFLKKAGFLSLENVEKAERFCIVAFKNDFWLDGAAIVKRPEEEFLIGEKYKIKGLIDKYGLYKDEAGDWYATIFDLKSQKNRFTEEELDFNLQAFSYLLAVKTNHPEINLLKSKVKFILLAYPEDPIQEFQLKTLDQINGFQWYLESTYKTINNFKAKDRLSHPASKQPYPPKDGGFKGPFMCGRANARGDLNKDGTKMWHCVYKFGFEYYVLLKGDKIVTSSFDPIPAKEGYTVEKRQYNGCEGCLRTNNTDTDL